MKWCALLEAVLARHPDHPYALHLLIHALEATDKFEQAKGAADRLRNYAPSLSHLTHMPSHIDIRRGDWDAAMTASERAIAADKEAEKLVGDPGFYRSMVLHNYHMLIYVAAMQGRSALATQTAKELLLQIPPRLIAIATSNKSTFFTRFPTSSTSALDAGKKCSRSPRRPTTCQSPRPCGNWVNAWHTSRPENLARRNSSRPRSCRR